MGAHHRLKLTNQDIDVGLDGGIELLGSRTEDFPDPPLRDKVSSCEEQCEAPFHVLIVRLDIFLVGLPRVGVRIVEDQVSAGVYPLEKPFDGTLYLFHVKQCGEAGNQI